MPKTKDPKLEEDRRNQIMMAAYHLLVSGSVQNLTLDKVAKASGISKGLVSYYFRGKDRLVTDTMAHILMAQKRALLELAHQDQPIEKRVRALIERALPSRSEVQNITKFLMETWSFAKNNPKTSRTVRDNLAEYRSICSEIIQLGIDEGYLKNIDAKVFSLMIYSLFDGLALQITLDPELDVTTIQNTVFDFIERFFKGR